MLAIKSRRIYMEDGMKDGFLLTVDGKIDGFAERVDGKNYIDCGNMRIIPGIFDTHNHGTCGYSLMGNGTKADVKGYLKGCASQGITGVFPTSGVGMISTVAESAGECTDGARILGIHSEGPWLNRTGEKGIRTGWPEVSIEMAENMFRAGGGLLRLVAMAPEIPGIEPLARFFLSKDITLAMAHSDCNFKQASKAYEMGFSVATHTGNVMTGIHHRDAGGLGAALLNDSVDCEVICDGKHICLEMLDIYFRVKSIDHFMMISDCTPFSGAPLGVYGGFDPGMKIHVSGDGFVLTDTGRLMGSSQPVLYGIGNLVKNLGMPMEKVLRMSSLNPCRKYGFEKQKGSLKAGKDADFVIITDDYKVHATYVEGKKVYDQSEGSIFNPEFAKEWVPERRAYE